MSSSLHKKALLGYNQHASFHGRSRNTLSVLQYSLFSGSRSPCSPFSCQLWHTSNVSVIFPPSADCPLAPSQVEITSYFTPLPVNACCTCATGRGDKRHRGEGRERSERQELRNDSPFRHLRISCFSFSYESSFFGSSGYSCERQNFHQYGTARGSTSSPAKHDCFL